MIRGRPGERGEVREGESKVQAIVGEGAVKTGKNRVGLLVRPCEKVVREIDLGDVELLDGVIEGRRESVVDLPVVLVGRAPNRVKIPEKDPGTRD